MLLDQCNEDEQLNKVRQVTMVQEIEISASIIGENSNRVDWIYEIFKNES
jgi:hypothetical protein